MANILLQKRTKQLTAVVGINWPSTFIKRRPELRIRYNRRITYQRAKMEDPKIIREWFQRVQQSIIQYGIHQDDIWNFDETGFAMGLCSTAKVITSADHS